MAEDSGLSIDALDGAPGVESARFGGVELPYPQKFALIDAALRAKGDRESTARFVCALALVQGDRVLFEARGTVEGRISPEPKGDGGFGYDPIFFYPPYGQTLAEAGAAKAQRQPSRRSLPSAPHVSRVPLLNAHVPPARSASARFRSRTDRARNEGFHQDLTFFSSSTTCLPAFDSASCTVSSAAFCVDESPIPPGRRHAAGDPT